MHIIHRWLALTLLLLAANAATAASTSNLAREKNWADQIVDTLIAGEAVALSADGTKFLGLYTAPAQPATKGLLFLHGRGVHPAWGFIDTLRVDFADAGWHTLSIQLPILENDVKFSEYGKTMPEALHRIDAGVRYLRAKGARRIFLVGHSTGAITAVAHAAERPASAVAGIVAIGLTTEPGAGPLMQAVPLLERVKKPVLDIFGADDLPVVLQTADARQASARRGGNPGYTQERVPGANHFFTDRYDALRSRITAWLTQAVK
ncbi:MAG: alpha/beta fold hydrolase [Gammaproteobacteria bacterium]